MVVLAVSFNVVATDGDLNEHACAQPVGRRITTGPHYCLNACTPHYEPGSPLLQIVRARDAIISTDALSRTIWRRGAGGEEGHIVGLRVTTDIIVSSI